MAKECWDCLYSKSIGDHRYKCKHRLGTFEGDSPACDNFLSIDKHTCDDCYYFDEGSYIWSSGKCRLKDKKVSGDSPQCSRFIES